MNPKNVLFKAFFETGKKVKHSGIFEIGRFKSPSTIALVEKSIIILKIAEIS